MKKLLTGNEAIARGAYEAGCLIASAYPGTPSTEILENVSQYREIYSEWSTNEKVALEVGCGASIAGARALVAMKHVGLNVAADPLFTIAYEGVNGGLVIITADEPGMHSSQNEQDNRLYAAHAKVAMVEPADSQECKDFIKEAFEISERFDTPVLFRVTTRVCHSKGLVELKDRKEVGIKEYVKDLRKYIMVPANAKVKHVEIEKERLPKLQEYSNTTSLNRIEYNDKSIGIIANGISYYHAKEVFKDKASYLKIGFSYPLPDKLIREFAEQVDKLYVIEENEPYMENFIKAMGIDCIGKEVLPICGELSPEIIRKALLGEEERESYTLDMEIPARPPTLCAGCPHRGIFYEVSKYKDKIIATSDIGCYTLGMAPPLGVGDTVICMGAGISAGIGFDRVNKKANRNKKVFGFVGDSTFFHSGITGLIDGIYNGTNMVIVILDNRTTGMTGHQENPGTGRNILGEQAPMIDIESLVKAVGIKEENIRVTDPYNLKETREAVKDAYESEEPFVIITKRPCALIKEVQRARRGLYCEVDQEKCRKCKACLRIGCPAISFRDNVISVDRAQCNGCSICLQVCPFDAIELKGKAGDFHVQ
ncbi:indolepyruvate ferredoxin oxidoreductase subunit alpha [Tepidimicrobium xylanilyticum]|uniref:Indolepyruvate oxidoreductase subunit IorA n=1 Tax=Tepidimicrobium xylanilyticum TaxID=1123352 RepID=A0A1H3CAP8_9FIRM|nr:indolepyruvate ferredoxin oxidoreductase subunit alpha [Tepidimicrobium xylanilyticum]SDX51120.1 indolepyruvate ferredoxin oxidoreductase alpha subunit [Tepidimicrobium xylanilyticum]